jgi:hypothetical protein
MNTLPMSASQAEYDTSPIIEFTNLIRKLVRDNLGHKACEVSLEEGYLQVKVVEVVKNIIVNGISNVMHKKTVLALDTSGMVPIEYQGSAESLGTSKYTLTEMVDELYAPLI